MANTQQKPKAPTHEVFNVLGDGDDAKWTKIGVGWQHKNGDGLNLAINCIPKQEGRTVVRKIVPREKAPNGSVVQ